MDSKFKAQWRQLKKLLPDEIFLEPATLAQYAGDKWFATHLPEAVALPCSTTSVQAILSFASKHKIPVTPRGAGHGYVGGCVPLHGGIALSTERMNRILEINARDFVAVVQPAVNTADFQKKCERRHLFYPPDPASRANNSIAGNIATNAGGPRCLKYGVTRDYLLGLEVVLADGTAVKLGGRTHKNKTGFDLHRLFVGSEGLLGVITEVTVRILKKPETAQALLLGFRSSEAGGDCVANIIAAGIIPDGMEMMDRPAIHAAEDFVNAGYPRDAEALLIVELDGPLAEVEELIVRVKQIAEASGCFIARISTSEGERMRFWAGRKSAFPAVGRISPDYLCMDGTIPRRQLPLVLRRMQELAEKHKLRVANVFHAGDGNLHPLILYDANRPGELDAAEEFGADILRLCVEVGGVLTGEHGVGIEKRDLMPAMFTEGDLAHQERLKCAFDPDGRLNPGKVFPVLHRCAELGRMHVHRGQVPFPDLPRF